MKDRNRSIVTDILPLHPFKKRALHKRAVLVSAAMILFIALVFPLPVRINRTLSGIRWESGDGQTEEECAVTVEGWYYRYLLKDNTFSGEIRFSTEDGSVSCYYSPNVTLYRGTMYEDRGGSLMVYDAALNQVRPLGYVAVSGNFKKIFIHSEEGSFSAPAADRSEAMELAKELVPGE